MDPFRTTFAMDELSDASLTPLPMHPEASNKSVNTKLHTSLCVCSSMPPSCCSWINPWLQSSDEYQNNELHCTGAKMQRRQFFTAWWETCLLDGLENVTCWHLTLQLVPKLSVLLVLNYSLGALANPLTHPPSSLTLPPCPPDMLLPAPPNQDKSKTWAQDFFFKIIDFMWNGSIWLSMGSY